MASCLDGGQNRPDRVDELQQAGGALAREPEPAVAQAGQQPFAGMGEDFELAESEEPARSFDRVDRAEDALQQRMRVGFLLEGDKISVELIEVLVALHEEFAHDLVELVHQHSSAPARTLRVTKTSQGPHKT